MAIWADGGKIVPGRLKVPSQITGIDVSTAAPHTTPLQPTLSSAPLERSVACHLTFNRRWPEEPERISLGDTPSIVHIVPMVGFDQNRKNGSYLRLFNTQQMLRQGN